VEAAVAESIFALNEGLSTEPAQQIAGSLGSTSLAVTNSLDSDELTFGPLPGSRR
jgi:hypothetical protein